MEYLSFPFQILRFFFLSRTGTYQELRKETENGSCRSPTVWLLYFYHTIFRPRFAGLNTLVFGRRCHDFSAASRTCPQNDLAVWTRAEASFPVTRTFPRYYPFTLSRSINFQKAPASKISVLRVVKYLHYPESMDQNPRTEMEASTIQRQEPQDKEGNNLYTLWDHMPPSKNLPTSKLCDATKDQALHRMHQAQMTLRQCHCTLQG